MSKSSECEGGAAADLASKLHKKYGAKPKMEARLKAGTATPASPKSSPKASPEVPPSYSSRQPPVPPAFDKVDSSFLKNKPKNPEVEDYFKARRAAKEAKDLPEPATANLELASLAELEVPPP
jgi:hypothetical protein